MSQGKQVNGYGFMSVAILAAVLISLIGVAIYLSKDDKKKKYYSTVSDEENNLSEYILLKP